MEAVEGVEPLHGRPNGFAAWLERRSEGTSKPLKNIEFFEHSQPNPCKTIVFLNISVRSYALEGGTGCRKRALQERNGTLDKLTARPIIDIPPQRFASKSGRLDF